MLISDNRIQNVPIFSLQTGTVMAKTSTPIIEPENLQVVAFFTEGPLVNKSRENILLAKSIREFSKMGMVVDSADELVAGEDIIKIKKILELNFNLIGLKVETKKRIKLGKVEGYNVTAGDLMVQQLVIKRPIMKSFIDPELIISRDKIVEITDTKIIIKDETEKKNLFSKQEIEQAFNREKANQFATVVRDDIKETTALK